MAKPKKNEGCLSALLGWGSSGSNDLTISPPPEDIKVKEPLPFRLRDDFLSTAEHSFYLVLKSMMGTYFTICPKVSLSDIFYVTNPDRNLSAYNRINRKHVDFLICESATMKPRFAIELDDKSHNRQNRMDRDEFVDELYETANLPLVHIPVRPTYNTNELGVLFREALAEGQKTPIPTGQPFTVPVGGAYDKPSAELVEGRYAVGHLHSAEHSAVLSSAGSPAGSTLPKSMGGKQPPFCPKCGQPMVLRITENGSNKGKKFWGCVNYPKCKMVKYNL